MTEAAPSTHRQQPGPRPASRTDRRTNGRTYDRAAGSRHGTATVQQQQASASPQRQQQWRRLWHGDGADRRHITRAASAAAAAASRPSSNYTPPTDRRAAIPPHSVVADRHDDDDGGGGEGGGSGRLDEIGSIVRRTERPDECDDRNRPSAAPLASESSDQCVRLGCAAALQAWLTGRQTERQTDASPLPPAVRPSVRPPTGRMVAARTQRLVAAVDSSISGRGRAFYDDYNNNDIYEASISRRRRATV